MTYRNSHFVAFSAAAEKALRHRAWKWCRLDNHFVDLPIWRVVAFKAQVPLYAVQAFVTRLESFANMAEPRGYVGDFSVDEFGAALGMTPDVSARIFVALCDPAVRWVDQEHVATFYGRNPDKPDDTAAERKRRSRSRSDVRKKLAALFRQGRLAGDERTLVEAVLDGLDDSDLRKLQVRLENALSTGHAGHSVTLRDIVTVTPREDQKLETGAVDNSEAEPGRETAGLAIEEVAPDDAISTEAATWLGSEAVRIVVQRMVVTPARAAMLVERWRRDLNGDDATMATIIAGADDANLTTLRFQISVTEQVKRHIVTRTCGQALHLPPVLSRADGKAAPAQSQPVAESPGSIADDAESLERRKAANE